VQREVAPEPMGPSPDWPPQHSAASEAHLISGHAASFHTAVPHLVTDCFGQVVDQGVHGDFLAGDAQFVQPWPVPLVHYGDPLLQILAWQQLEEVYLRLAAMQQGLVPVLVVQGVPTGDELVPVWRLQYLPGVEDPRLAQHPQLRQMPP